VPGVLKRTAIARAVQDRFKNSTKGSSLECKEDCRERARHLKTSSVGMEPKIAKTIVAALCKNHFRNENLRLRGKGAKKKVQGVCRQEFVSSKCVEQRARCLGGSSRKLERDFCGKGGEGGPWSR